MSTTEPPIENAIIKRCADLATDAGERVYREFIQAEPELPVIVVTRVGGGPLVRVLGGDPGLFDANIRIEIIDVELARLDAVYRALVAGLDGWRATILGVVILSSKLGDVIEGSSEVDGDQILRIRQLDFRFIHRGASA